MPDADAANAEFDRQVAVLVELGYPRLTGQPAQALRDALEPLRAVAVERPFAPPTRARVPFVIVLSGRIAKPTDTMPLTTYNGRSGFVARDTKDIDEFPTHDSVELPADDAWLIFDVDRGTQTLGAKPDEARPRFARAGRSPLTIEEGIAFLTQFPESLEKNNCFQLPGTQLDRKVPGLWISDRAPKLGFCWAGNRHTWLGHASCAERVAPS